MNGPEVEKDAERLWDEGHSAAFGHGKHLCPCINKNPYRERNARGAQDAPIRWPDTPSARSGSVVNGHESHIWRAVGPNAAELWNQCANCKADENSTQGRLPCRARVTPPTDSEGGPMTGPDIEGVLAAHEGCSFDLGTPRQYTQHGGWNVTCACGVHLCSHSDDCICHRAHVAAAVRAKVAAWLSSEAALVALAKAVAEYQACGYCEGECAECRTEASALVDALAAQLTPPEE